MVRNYNYKMPPTRIDHTNTKCYLCGKSYSSGGWIKYRNEEGKWDRKSYICSACNIHTKRYGFEEQYKDKIEKYRREYFERKFKLKGRICHICKRDGIDCKLRYKDERGNWDGKSFLCDSCYKNLQKYMPGTVANFMMSEAKCRKGEFDIKRGRCRGCIGVQIVASIIGSEDLNIKMDKFNYYVDLYDSKYGYSEVKTAILNIRDGRWSFNLERIQEYDTLFLVCMDENEYWKNVERVYLIPWEEAILHGTGISITKNSSRRSWYDKYRIDEKPFNSTFHNMNIECPMSNKI